MPFRWPLVGLWAVSHFLRAVGLTHFGRTMAADGTGEGDVRPLRGEFAGSYRLRVGKWRVFVLLEGTEIFAYQIDNRGEAY